MTIDPAKAAALAIVTLAATMIWVWLEFKQMEMGMQIDPKTQMWISAVVAVVFLAAKGTVSLPLGVPPDWGAYLTSWANFATAIYLVLAPILLGYSSSQPGPFAPPDSPAVKAATAASAPAPITRALAAFALMGLGLVALGGHARADSRDLLNGIAAQGLPTKLPPFVLPTSPAQALVKSPSDQAAGNMLDELNAAVLKDAIADLTAGKAVFDGLKNSAGSNCYGQILNDFSAFQAAVTSNAALPKVHVFYDLSIVSSLALDAQPNSPVALACAALANQVGQSVLTIVNGGVTGALKVAPILAPLLAQ